MKFSSRFPVLKSALYTFLTQPREEGGAELNQRDIMHLTGILARDMSKYSKAEVTDTEENMGRAILARQLNAFPELYDYLHMPTFAEIWQILKHYYPNIEKDDVSVIIGGTAQNARRWLDRQHTDPKSPVFLKNMRAIKIVHQGRGGAGIDYIVACVTRECRLMNKPIELSDYMLEITDKILKAKRFSEYEKSLFEFDRRVSVSQGQKFKRLL